MGDRKGGWPRAMSPLLGFTGDIKFLSTASGLGVSMLNKECHLNNNDMNKRDKMKIWEKGRGVW